MPTDAARPILKGEQPVMLREELVTQPARGSLRARGSIEAPSDPASPPCGNGVSAPPWRRACPPM
ncbi:hypothetical protein ACFQU7_06795 [Pseudoroseomonas wenyumeiae]